MRKILVTGATGFLGSHIVRELLEQDFQVIILKRLGSDIRRIKNILADIIVYDLENLNLACPFTQHGKVDAVIHTATCYGRNNEPISKIFRVNTHFPLQVLEAAINAGVNTFINTDTVLDKFLNSYSLSKFHFKEIAEWLADISRIKFVNIKLEHMYGPNDGDNKFTSHVIKSCVLNIAELDLTGGEQKRDFIYIDDVVSAYLILLKRIDQLPAKKLHVELGSGHAVTLRNFVESVHRISQSSTRLKFGAIAYRDKEVMFSQANIDFLKSLGWSCKKTLDEGIGLSVSWHKEHKDNH